MADLGPKQTLPQAVNILTNKYLPARRNYLFITQSIARGGQIPSAQPADAVINFGAIEFNPASGNQLQEYIELVNTNGYAVDISGWQLAGGIAHTFAGGVVLPAGAQTLCLAERRRSSERAAPDPAAVKVYWSPEIITANSRRAVRTINLFDSAGRTVSSTTYIGNPSPAQQYLRITEIMYHPPPPSAGSSFTAEDFEYIVLKNSEGRRPRRRGGPAGGGRAATPVDPLLPPHPGPRPSGVPRPDPGVSNLSGTGAVPLAREDRRPGSAASCPGGAREAPHLVRPRRRPPEPGVRCIGG